VEKSFAAGALIFEPMNVTRSAGTFQLLFYTYLYFGVRKTGIGGIGRGLRRKTLSGGGKEILDGCFGSSQIERFHFASVSGCGDFSR
jgi:hypothetical protein